MALMIAFTAAQAQLPSNWTDDTGIETFKESTTVHGGEYSCGVIVNTDAQANCNLINQVAIPVNAGESFTVSFWGITSPKVLVRAFFYWEGVGTNFSPTYLAPGTQQWAMFSYQDTVPAGAVSLKIGLRFYDVTGFVPGEIQYVDDVRFESPNGNSLTVSNGDFESWAILKPEPTAYPDNFTGTQKGFSILTSWTDAAGDQLPDNYLILASKEAITTIPQDGIYYPDDFNLMDGNGFANVVFGKEQFAFTRLESLTNYYFRIFPYTNSGSNIQYKTDGTAPELVLEIPDVKIIAEQNFDDSWAEWKVVSISGDQQWGRDNNSGIQETPCARISGRLWGTVYENHDWLISPPMDFTLFTDEFISFYSTVGFTTAEVQLRLKISTDYAGNADPLSATWADLDPLLPDSAVSWVWTWSGENDVAAYESENVHFAFVYQCGTQAAATWQIDDILISGQTAPPPEPDEYPSNFAMEAGYQQIIVSWQDALGEVIPSAYLLQFSNEDDFVLPQNDSLFADDLDFGDGKGTINILPGTEQYTFSGLADSTTYFATIIPYHSADGFIRYKTDPAPPKDSAATAPPNGIFDATESAGLNIFPNPGKGVFYFEADKTIQSVQVFTLGGKLIFDGRISDSKGSLNLTNFEKGSYLAVFRINKTLTIKQHIIIQ